MTQRISRLLEVVKELADGDVPTIDELTQRLGVSRRTVFRDLRALRDSGVSLRFDRARRAYGLRDAGTPRIPAQDDLAELLRQALVTALPVTANSRQQARRAAEVLARNLDERRQLELRELRESIASLNRRSAVTRRVAGVFSVIAESIARKRCVTIGFGFEESSEDALHDVQPIRLRLSGEDWLLEGVVAQNHTKLRARVDRIASAEVSDRPAADLAKHMTLWRDADIELL